MNFLKKAVQDLLTDDGLIVMSRSCGYRELFARFVKYYALKMNQTHQVVFILNADNAKELILMELVPMSLDPALFPQEITTNSGTAKERQQIYKQGGVFFISARILQLDFLQNHLPYSSIAGLLVYDADSLHAGSTYLFCLLLFRIRCKGFVKCFSDNSQGCYHAFPQLASFLKELTVNYLFLYPRSRDIVVSSYEQYPIEVEEVTYVYSEWMETVNRCIEMCLRSNIAEIKRLRCDLNESLTLDFCLQTSFPSFVRRDLENHGSGYSQKTRDLLNELISLSKLSRTLHYFSIITLFEQVNTITHRLRNGSVASVCYWMETKESELLLKTLQNEIFGILDGKVSLEDWLEPPQKWSGLITLLKELEASMSGDSKKVVLISVMNTKSIVEIHNFLTNTQMYMWRSLQHSLYRYITYQNLSSNSTEQQLLSFIQTRFESVRCETGGKHQICLQQVKEQINSHNGLFEVLHHDFSHLQIYLFPSSLAATLHNPFQLCSPSILIIVDANVVAIRQAEQFNCQTKGKILEKVFFCCYEGREQRNYELELKREVDGFARLIEERKHLVHSTHWSQKQLSKNGSSRDLSKSESQSLIIVDSREFNASLPSALFKTGFQLIPITLNVCDYVLSPDTGVERKAFQDLVSSLSSGRLQKQMEQMSRLYRVPLLLIEMDDGEHGLFKLTGEATMTTSRLLVLLRSYPQMRILWSFSDRSSSRLFEMLKRGREEPALEKIMMNEGDSYLNGKKDEVNRVDLLLQLPGIGLHNVYGILRRIQKVSDICQWTKEQLEEVMTPLEASSLFAFLHTPFPQG